MKKDKSIIYHGPRAEAIQLIRRNGMTWICDHGYFELDSRARFPFFGFGWSNGGPAVSTDYWELPENEEEDKRMNYWARDVDMPTPYWKPREERGELALFNNDGTSLSTGLTPEGLVWKLDELIFYATPEQRRSGYDEWKHVEGFRAWAVWTFFSAAHDVYRKANDLHYWWYLRKHKKGNK